MRRVRMTAVVWLGLMAALSPAAARAAAVATTGTATNVTSTSATLQGTVNPVNADSGYAFQYGRTATYGQTTKPGTASSPMQVSAAVGNLSPNTTYHFRLIVEDTGSDPAVFHAGADQTFTTTAVAGTAAVTGDATSIKTTSATLHGVADLAVAGAWAFQYGTSSSFGKGTPSLKLDPGVHAVAATIGNLQPNTTYHYRLVVVQPSSSAPYYTFAVGAERTFRTAGVATAHGRARLAGSTVRVRRGSAGVRLRCSGAGRCAGRVSLSTRAGHRTLGCGSAGFSLAGGRTGTVTVKLSSGCAARLAAARGRRLTATLRVRFTTHQAPLRRTVILIG